MHDAESLIRSLDGVAHVRIHPGDSGIDAIHVTVSDDEAAHCMAGHVRSALLAGLATPVTPGRIHVRVSGDADTGTHDSGSADSAQELARAPRRRIRLLEDHAANGAGHDHDQASVPRRTGASTDTPADRPEPELAARPAHALSQDDDAPSPVRNPRLVAVDVDRTGDGRVRCRVAIAHAADVQRAEAMAVDLPGAAAQAAAQATVRALIDAGIPDLQLNGLREVEIAGHDYVVVALRTEDTSRRHRSGSAPIVGSPERSAAEATVAAAIQLI